jgi:hypothetical protein
MMIGMFALCWSDGEDGESNAIELRNLMFHRRGCGCARLNIG